MIACLDSNIGLRKYKNETASASKSSHKWHVTMDTGHKNTIGYTPAPVLRPKGSMSKNPWKPRESEPVLLELKPRWDTSLAEATALCNGIIDCAQRLREFKIWFSKRCLFLLPEEYEGGLVFEVAGRPLNEELRAELNADRADLENAP